MNQVSIPISFLSSPLMHATPRRLQFYSRRDLNNIPQLSRLPAEHRAAMAAISMVLPFRANNYVVEELIDWDRVPDDPVFQLVFPQPGMLDPGHLAKIMDLSSRGAADELEEAVKDIRRSLNPHPAGQLQHNIPRLPSGRPLPGIQHKYRETVLFFPSKGQTCHAYCSFCFRWPQFIGDRDLRISSSETSDLVEYLRDHKSVTDLLVTGGDPMVMRAEHLSGYLEPLLNEDLSHVSSIRIGTKALSFWPHRFVDAADSDTLMRLFERLVSAGKHVALMAHFNHWRELETDTCRAAISRILSTGVKIRSQGPLLANINDSADVWSRLWQTQVKLGIVPYYMFVERDTGASRYFKVPLVRAWEIYRDAISQVSGLARTARGPSMSAGPGKVEVVGVETVNNEQVFVLRFLQARNASWAHRPFFARFDENATWLNDLRPAFGQKEFFFESEYQSRWPEH